jgi:uncharacterized protein
MSSGLSESLSEAETARLAERLAANARAGALRLEGVDGLFCALLASPTSILPSEVLPAIFPGEGTDPGAFADLEDAQETLSMLMRCWNSIAAEFADEGLHLPYIEEPGTDGIPGRDWARGFMQGTRLAPAGWGRLFTDEKEGLSVSIALVAGEVDPQWPNQPLPREKADELLQWMIAGAARAYRYFEADRRDLAEIDAALEEAEAAPHVRAEAKVGRNDPCPCGSGKKFKKCCGSPDQGSAL